MTDLPDDWAWEPGEGSRPLSESGGYYHGVATHTSGEYTVTVDTTGMSQGVDEHVVNLERLERADNGDILRREQLELEAFEASDKDDEFSQEAAEEQAEEYAVELMRAVNNGDYDE